LRFREHGNSFYPQRLRLLRENDLFVIHMKKMKKIVVITIVVPVAAFTIYAAGVAYNTGKPKKPVIIPDAVVQERFRKETTFATKSDIDTRIQPVALEEIISDTSSFSQIEINTNESRRDYTANLFKEAGYDPVVMDNGSVHAVKEGLMSDFVAVGAHYDKVDGPSEGILDNMLGCILISNIAEAMLDEPTKYTYVFLTYGDEELGSKIGSATFGNKSNGANRPTYVIEMDYVGDMHSELGGRWIGPMAGRFQKTGIKITTYPQPKPPTIHTERDNISNVDFSQAYLAYKTVISLIEGIETRDELVPPDTVNFWRKDKPLHGRPTHH